MCVQNASDKTVALLQLDLENSNRNMGCRRLMRSLDTSTCVWCSCRGHCDRAARHSIQALAVLPWRSAASVTPRNVFEREYNCPKNTHFRTTSQIYFLARHHLHHWFTLVGSRYFFLVGSPPWLPLQEDPSATARAPRCGSSGPRQYSVPCRPGGRRCSGAPRPWPSVP